MNHITNIDHLKSDGNSFTSFSVRVRNFGREKWVITMCETKRRNYVIVRKVSHNPFGKPGIGKEFDTISDAVSNYKSKSMISALEEVEQIYSNYNIH